MPKRKRDAAADAGTTLDTSPQKKKQLRAAEDDALAALVKAQTALRAAPPPSVTLQRKLSKMATALRAMVDSAGGVDSKIRAPRVSAADGDAAEQMRKAADSLERVGTTGFARRDEVMKVVLELQQLIDGTQRKAQKQQDVMVVVPEVVVPEPAPQPAHHPVIDTTPHPEHTLDDEQEMPLNVLDPDDEGQYDWDEFSMLDHLTNFVYQEDDASDDDTTYEGTGDGEDGAFGFDGYYSDDDDDDDGYYSDD